MIERLGIMAHQLTLSGKLMLQDRTIYRKPSNNFEKVVDSLMAGRFGNFKFPIAEAK